jgi:hypothetical protein
MNSKYFLDVHMPDITIFLPRFLIVDMSAILKSYDISQDTFIALSIAEKLREIKYGLVAEANEKASCKPQHLSFNTFSISEVTPLGNCLLHIKFTDNLVGDFDVKPFIEEGGIFTDLSDIELFKTVSIQKDGNSIAWKGGIEIGAETLYTNVWLSDY